MMLTLNERHLIECQGIQSNVLLLKLPFPLHGEITHAHHVSVFRALK